MKPSPSLPADKAETLVELLDAMQLYVQLGMAIDRRLADLGTGTRLPQQSALMVLHSLMMQGAGHVLTTSPAAVAAMVKRLQGAEPRREAA